VADAGKIEVLPLCLVLQHVHEAKDHDVAGKFLAYLPA
jgi:hypothetical protein